jgi:hypothetical protein
VWLHAEKDNAVRMSSLVVSILRDETAKGWIPSVRVRGACLLGIVVSTFLQKKKAKGWGTESNDRLEEMPVAVAIHSFSDALIPAMH